VETGGDVEIDDEFKEKNKKFGKDRTSQGISIIKKSVQMHSFTVKMKER